MEGVAFVDGKMLDLSNVWPEWEAVQKVGEGSFGKVFKCVRKEYDIETVCAIKVVSVPQSESEVNAIRAEYSSEESVKAHFKEVVDEFANEIKMMVLLKGAPNIVSVENYKIVERKDTIGWDIYIQMEFLTTFSEFSRKNSFTERAVAKLATDICSALEVCGEKNIIHRDIKPENIFIDNYGSYKIGDFGVARKLENVASAMSKKGTYTYMAPEVYHSAAYDNRADIYSLGMVMYKLLNRGRDPFTDPLAESVAYREREAALVNRMRGENLPAPVDASLAMSKIIIKACAFDPNKRFATPSEFKAELKKYLASAPQTGNVPVQQSNGNGSGKELSASKNSKSLPLFTDDIIHDKSKSIDSRAPQKSVTPADDPYATVVSRSSVNPAGQQKTAVSVAPPVRPNAAATFKTAASVNSVTPVQTTSESPKKKSKGKLFAVIGVAVAVIIAAVLIAVFVGGGDDPDVPATTAATTQAVTDDSVASEVKKYTLSYFREDYENIRITNYLSERKVYVDDSYCQIFTADVDVDGETGYILCEAYVVGGEVKFFDYLSFKSSQKEELYAHIESFNAQYTDKDLEKLLEDVIAENK